MNKEKIQKALGRFLHIRLKKIHLDYIAGILSIPVLITAIIINWGNLTHKTTVPVSPSPSPQVIVVPQDSGSQNVAPTAATCIRQIGPISISSPQEGETVTDNPVCVTIDYANPNYCSVVWAYRINGGSWSDFNNTSPCLYNLPNGAVRIDVRVNSTVSSDQKVLSRSFVYAGSTIVATPTPTPTSTPMPTPTITPAASSSAH